MGKVSQTIAKSKIADGCDDEIHSYVYYWKAEKYSLKSSFVFSNVYFRGSILYKIQAIFFKNYSSSLKGVS